MRRLIISCAVVAVALLAQLTFVNRLALPGGTGPDLVLLAVVALALTGGPIPGMLTGFLAGLALDVAPPASHTIGQYALVFCLVGYGCGRLAGLGEASPALYVGISAAAAAVGAALHAALGVMLSDPEVTWAAVRRVLPPSLIYDVILSPFVLYAVVRLNGWAGRSATEESAPAVSAARPATVGAGAGAVRPAGAPGTPRLNLADRRGGGSWIAAARTASAARPAAVWRPDAQRDLKLHFSGSRGAGLAGRPARGAGPARPAGASSPKMNFRSGRRDRLAGGSSAAPPRAAAPRFRRHSATIGTGGALSASTPRRGTFGRRARLAGRGTFGGRRSFGTRQPPASAGRDVFRRRRSRVSFGRTSLGRTSLGGSVPGRGKAPRRGSFGTTGRRPRPGLAGRGRTAPRLRMRRGKVRARVQRFLHRGAGGYR